MDTTTRLNRKLLKQAIMQNRTLNVEIRKIGYAKKTFYVYFTATNSNCEIAEENII